MNTLPEHSAVSRELMDLVLAPYLPPCRYMKQAFARVPDTASANSSLVLHADFVIPSSCYINSTGHFNAVESNICVNQLAYLLFAWSLRGAKDHPFSAEVGPFDMETFREKQLPNMWILSLQTSFRRAINPHGFQGTIEWTHATRTRTKLLLLEMSFRFSDGERGQAEGQVKFGIN
ncbi:FcoT family thioesterase [Melittangium boletus]|uniref:(2E)-enoyl-[ACP] glycyltransferase n=1 Tax=Melittangium boletus DSM 14713 TaxID=1294270 RepID=A0A250IE29_9BACT|nr:FcoT family thioesterase [Melittangium boletus]ATB30099.1 hypothetical protein MEBOL_003554 [Melittangium boletus DSM 14713]